MNLHKNPVARTSTASANRGAFVLLDSIYCSTPIHRGSGRKCTHSVHSQDTEEKRILVRYTGWGHSPQVFDEIKADYWQSHVEGEYSHGYSRGPQGLKNWADKFYEHYGSLKALLTPEEWSAA